MDPNHIVEALQLILSGDQNSMTRGENVMDQAKRSDSFLKTLMIIGNNQEVSVHLLASKFWKINF